MSPIVLVTLLLLSSLLIAIWITGNPTFITLGITGGLVILIISFLSPEASIYLLLFSMLLSPEIVIAETPAREVTIRLEDLILAIIVFSWFGRVAIFKELGLFVRTPLNRPIFTIVTIYLLSTTMGVMAGYVKPLSGLFFTLKYIEYFFIYFMVLNLIHSKDQIKRLLVAAFIVSLLVSLYAISQIPSGERVTAPFEGRYGGEPNTLGGYLVLMIAMAGGIALKVKSDKVKIALGGLIVIMVVPLLYSLSRGSWVAFMAVPAVFLFYSKRWMLVPLLVVTALGLPFITPRAVEERFIYTFKPDPGFRETQRIGRFAFDPSTSERIASFKRAFWRWTKRPILGYGVTGGGFMDNQYFRMLLETGSLGFLAFLWMNIAVFRESWRYYTIGSDDIFKGLSLGLMAGVVAMLVHSIGASTFIIVRIMEPFWFFVATVMALGHLEPTLGVIGRERRAINPPHPPLKKGDERGI